MVGDDLSLVRVAAGRKFASAHAEKIGAPLKPTLAARPPEPLFSGRRNFRAAASTACARFALPPRPPPLPRRPPRRAQ